MHLWKTHKNLMILIKDSDF